VLWGYGSEEEILAAAPDRVVGSMEELCGWMSSASSVRLARQTENGLPCLWTETETKVPELIEERTKLGDEPCLLRIQEKAECSSQREPEIFRDLPRQAIIENNDRGS
jgi:hypothetical protein